MFKIDFWKKNFDNKIINFNLKKNILNRNISEGQIVSSFEKKISNWNIVVFSTIHLLSKILSLSILSQ